MNEDNRMRECDVLVQIDLSKVKLQEVMEAEKALRKLGITFDTGAGFGFRDWEWDFSLKGPINVYFQQFKKEEKTDGLNTCQCCLKEYSRSETIRRFGDTWWTGIYCTAQCLTKAKEKVNENQSSNS